MSKASSVLTGAAVLTLTAAGLLASAGPAYAGDVGGLDISRYCRTVLGSNWYASTTNPSDPYSWRCRTASGASLLVGLGGLHDTCRIQYGKNAVAVLIYYSAYGWRCYR